MEKPGMLDLSKMSPDQKAVYDAMVQQYQTPPPGHAGSIDVAALQKENESLKSQNEGYKSQVDQWQKFGDSYRQNVEPYWPHFTQYMQTATGGQTHQPAPQGNPGVTQGNGHGNPSVAATRGPATYLTDEQIAAQFQALRNENAENQRKYAAVIQQKELQFLTLIGLQDQVATLRRDHPGVDTKKILDYMKDHNVSDVNLAYRETYADEERNTFAQQRVEEERKKWDEEQKNKLISTLPPTGPLAPKLTRPTEPKTVQDAAQKTREAVAQKYGTGVLFPGGISTVGH